MDTTGGRELRDSPRFRRVATELLRQGHAVRFRAHGWSMFPAIRDGEMVTVAPVSTAPVQIGDVVLVPHGRGVLAHRVVAMSRAGGRVMLTVRGDASCSCDPPVAIDQVLGVVVSGDAAAASGVRRFIRGLCLRALRRAAEVVHNVRLALARTDARTPEALR